MINFAQGEEEGIDQAWDRFNGMIEQGLKLGFSGDVLLHTFYLSLTAECMQFVQMCAGGDLMKKTLMEATQLLQKISKGAAIPHLVGMKDLDFHIQRCHTDSGTHSSTPLYHL